MAPRSCRKKARAADRDVANRAVFAVARHPPPSRCSSTAAESRNSGPWMMGPFLKNLSFIPWTPGRVTALGQALASRTHPFRLKSRLAGARDHP